MRTPLLLLSLTLSACANDLPKDPNVDADADADEGSIEDADADADVGPTGDQDADADADADADTDADADADGGPAVDQDEDGYPSDVDCDDDDADTFPGASEVCDGQDNDCDGRVDDEDDDVTLGTSTFYADRDGDGLGDLDGAVEACAPPEGYVADDTDCDDTSASVGGPSMWYFDNDLDGYPGAAYELACIQPAGTYPTSADCNDDDPTVNPGADDLCGDDIDSDCGGEDDWVSCIDMEPADLVGTITCSEDAGPFTVSGDHIQVNYGDHGMWWDEDSALAGLEVDPSGTGEWVDVTYPGVHLDQLFIKRGTSAYTIGSPSGSETDNLNLLCSESVAVGDVVGAIHRYNIDGSPVFVLTKTELWNRSSKSMLVHFGLTHSILSPDASFTLQRITDPDQDADAGTTDVFFENPLGDPLLTAEGPETGLTIGIGRCSYQSSNGAYDGTSWSALTEPVASCDPDGMTEDLPFTFQTSATTVPSGGSLNRGFVLTVGTDVWESVDEWDDNKLGLCADLYDFSASPMGFRDCTTREPLGPITPSTK